MKPAPFKYVRPESVAEALSVLASYGEDVRVMAGGQSLGAMLNMRIVKPAIVMDINRLADLNRIEFGPRTVSTGAMVRQRDALDNHKLTEYVPLLNCALPNVGHYQTRNRGTLGGSVAHADPSAEIPLTLATLGGEVELRSRRRKRTLPAADFFRSALTTARASDELVTALRWPVAKRGDRTSFREFAVRAGDFAIVAVAAALEANGTLRMGVGGCGDVPQVAIREGANFNSDGAIAELASEMTQDLEYRSDLLATSDYRKHLAMVLARETLGDLAAMEHRNA